MKNGNQNNQSLDALSRRLFRSESFDADKVDRVISDPRLYYKVLERISAERAAAKPVQKARLSGKLVALSSSALAVLLVVGFVFINSSEKPKLQQVSQKAPVQQVVNNKVPDDAVLPDKVVLPEVPPQPIPGKLSEGRTTKDPFKPEKAVYRREERGTSRSVTDQSDMKFLPVAYTGDNAETSAGARVIRVDLKRSSLFALGVDLPLENDVETVKADILIGSDGVMRGVRVVN